MRAEVLRPCIGCGRPTAGLRCEACRAPSAARRDAPAEDPQPAMNRTEAEYAALLAAEPGVLSVVFGSVKFRLAKRCWYTPDLVALTRDGLLVVEVKGAHVRDDGRDRFKIAAAQYPLARWRMVQKTKAGWRTVYEFDGRPKSNGTLAE
jgi:hypothetical protein